MRASFGMVMVTLARFSARVGAGAHRPGVEAAHPGRKAGRQVERGDDRVLGRRDGHAVGHERHGRVRGDDGSQLRQADVPVVAEALHGVGLGDVVRAPGP